MGPRPPVGRFRLSCRASRPPKRSSPPPGCPLPGVRRGRTPGSMGGGTGAIPPRTPPRNGGPPVPVRSLAASACRCSCLRMWSASGLEPPAFALRIASSGSLTSGFWAAGSCEPRARGAGRDAAGIGASLNAGRGTGLGPSPPGRCPPGPKGRWPPGPRGRRPAGRGRASAAGFTTAGASGWGSSPAGGSGCLPRATPAGAM